MVEGCEGEIAIAPTASVCALSKTGVHEAPPSSVR